MKNKRQGIEISDFSGGLNTKASLVGTDPKYSPDCLNVYAEGKALRKRNGITVLNPTAVSGNPNGNGVYNWVKSVSNQLLIAAFGSATYSMDNSTGWDGVLDTFSNDSANGTAFSDAIRHFVTFNNTLIMTSEARDKPQYTTVNDASHFNIEYLGAGTGPQGKYLQVWKEHLWVLNIGQGGSLTEDANDISAWTDNDTGTGSSTQTTFSGEDTFRFLGGTNAADNAKRTRDIGTIPDDYTVEIRSYYDILTTIATGNYASVNLLNGVVNAQFRWSDDGLEINDGTNWNEVGVDLVSEDVWAIWKFVVTGGTATAARVDVLKDGSYVGLQYPLFAASTASDGQINLNAVVATATSRPDWYLDYIYINTSTSVIDRIANGGFEDWGGGLPTSWNVYPTQPLIHYRLNDNAANATVTDSGVVASNASVFANVTTINSSVVSSAGKISNSFSFDASSLHNINLTSTAVTSMRDDTAGTLAFWFYPNNSVDKYTMFSIAGISETLVQVSYLSSGKITFELRDGGVSRIDSTTTASYGSLSFHHLVITQNATTLSMYVNGDSVGLTASGGSNNLWFAALGTALTQARIASLKQGTLAEAQLFPGRIDDFRYYSSALSTLEIASIYAEGNGNEAVVGVVQEGTTIKLGSNSLRINSTGEYSITAQTLSTGSAIAGVSSIIGAWVNATNLSTYKFRVTAGTNNSDSAVLTGNGTWQYQTFNFTPTSGATTVGVQLITTSSSTVYFDHVAVIASSSGVITDNSDRLQRSAVTTYNDWSGTDSGYNDITTPGDVGLTGSGILNDKMYVFKKWSVHRVTYTGSTPLLDIKQAKATVGTASSRSIRNIDIPGRGEVLIFLGTDRRIYLFDGYETIPISDVISVNNGISSVYMKNINAQALDKVWAIVHSDLNWYELFVPIGSSTVPDYSIVVDFSNQQTTNSNIAFWPNDNKDFKSGAVSDNGIGQRVVYAQGNTDGRIYLTISGDSDNGTNINGYWNSFKVGSPVLLGKIDELEVQTDSVACTPTFAWRMDWESSYISKTLSSSSYSHNYNPGRLDNLTQFRITDNSSNPSFKLWFIGLYERILGGGK